MAGTPGDLWPVATFNDMIQLNPVAVSPMLPPGGCTPGSLIYNNSAIFLPTGEICMCDAAGLTWNTVSIPHTPCP